ncbi:hypothetical protein Atai01_82040 [Amycolatopsis taiwanensis]|uniref:Uncharacterized protein n=1 Tax=Amycolatopsis taiwanensis TaxID=342230 RepID=A0A9W6VKD6_9PSEU|nr:hypothetical protein Atai01_82040 [Amycolatopsis taiwanensis]
MVAALLVRTGVIEGSALGVLAGLGALAVAVIAGIAGRRPHRGAPRRVLLITAAAISGTGLLAAGQLLWNMS